MFCTCHGKDYIFTYEPTFRMKGEYTYSIA